MRNAHSRILSMARKLKMKKNEKHTVECGILRETVKNVKNEKYTQQDLEYGKKHSEHGK